jgi:diguanylate cyclase (GGDEF)-like protein
MADLNLFSTYIHALEPSSVLSVGGAVAISTALMMAIQAYQSRTDRLALSVAAVSLLFAAISFVLVAPIYFQAISPWQTYFSVMLGTSAFFCGMCCLTLFFQPKFPRSLLIGCGAICVLGYLRWPMGDQLSHWFFVCQLLIALLTIYMLATAKDTLAPAMRWFAMATAVFVAIGAGPRLWWILNSILDPSLVKPQTESSEFRFGALVWVIATVLFHATVVGIVQARSARRLKDSSDFDVLTGAFSRRYLFEVGESLVLHRSATSTDVTALLIDVDHFKSVNDTWGHVVGDRVLQHCVQNILEVTRQTDAIVSRYGGEEFCVLLSKQSAADAKRVAERIRQRMETTPFLHGQAAIAVTVSIGVSSEVSGANLSELIACADQQLYRAKHEGRNRVAHKVPELLPA